MVAKKKKKVLSKAKRKTKPPLPPRRRARKTSPPPAARRRKATGFASIVRGVAEAAVREEGVGGAPAGSTPRAGGHGASMPEITLSHTPAGRETLAAIEREMGKTGVRVTTRTKEAGRPRRPVTSSPDVSIAYKPGGHDTLDAIDTELDPSQEAKTGTRTRRRTLGFEQRPLKDVRGRTVQDSAPEVITVEERPIGRTTLAAIASEAAVDDSEVSVAAAAVDDETLAAIAAETSEAGEPESQTQPARARTGLEIHEVVTFVIHGLQMDDLQTPEQRRSFVARNLMHRLPVWSKDDIDRVDVARADSGEYLVVQILCRLTAGG